LAGLLEHSVKGEIKQFEGFLPSNLTVEEREQEAEVKIKNLDLRKHNLILELNQEKEKRDQSVEFNKIKLGGFYSGKIIRIIKHGTLVNIEGLVCLLPNSAIVYNSTEVKPSDYLSVGQTYENFMVISKKPESGKIYLSARHIFDSYDNYFKENERYQAIVNNFNLRKTSISIQDINLSVPTNSLF
jgi:ribosomal protein S1